MSRKLFLALVGSVSMLASLLAVGPAGAQSGGSPSADDTLHPPIEVLTGTLPVVDDPASGSRAAAAPAAAAADAAVGDVRNWVGLDDAYGFYYRKAYTLRAIRNNVEIWVASEANRVAPATTAVPPVGQSSGLAFLDNDCRNGARTTVSDTQANYLADQFQNNILPKESAAFSVAPDRDGTAALLTPPTFNSSGPGQRTVVLVDNVRDDNFYDVNNSQGLSYIAGFFSSQLNAFFDRNVMTIDGFDWLHRTGATPPNEPVANDNCASAPARPFLYEGVFAHEYQHLLESYEDGDEASWVNEGLSDWAQTLTGYVDTLKPITDVGFDSHVQCFLGYLGQQTPANPNPRPRSGPENSLTRWGDQGDAEILCDYGAAYTFMLFLAGRYGTPFMSALHRNDANGFVGLQAVLDQTGVKKQKAIDVFHDWTIMVAVDGLLDDGATLKGGLKAANLSTPGLHATINWDTPEAYSTPGAPSNGSDYVRLRDAKGGYLRGKKINSLSFKGATSLPAEPTKWNVDPNPPGHSGDPALVAGSDSNLDDAAVQSVTVPAGAKLTFDARWNTEDGWDFGFVQVSTDGGTTYTSVACTDTTTVTDPDALTTVKDNLPGFTGDSAGFRPQTCDLAAYAGQTVLLAFRIITDPNTLGTDPGVPPGFWVDNITVGTTLVSDGSSIAGWKSFTEIKPVPVSGYVVTLISVRTKNENGDVSERNRGNRRGARVTIKRLPLTADFQLKRKAEIDKYIDEDADFVAAVVTYDDPGESVTQYSPYTLTVNGVVQPGGK